MGRAIPVLRIDNYAEAKAYYVGFLGFKIDFEWRHEEGFPVYLGLSRGVLVLHLTEHRGDMAGPGAAHVQVKNVREFHAELMIKRSAMSEELVDQAWGATEFKLVDPFDNRPVFTNSTPKPD